MPRHNCAQWTDLGFPCPGSVRERARTRSTGVGEGEDELVKFRPPLVAHDMPKVMPPQLDRWLIRHMSRKIVTFFRHATSADRDTARRERTIKMEELETPIRLRDIPFDLGTPIPEIAITGATAAAIMIAAKAFGTQRGETFVNEVIRSKGRITRVRPTSGQTGGVGFRFNAADELRKKLQLRAESAGGAHFPGILG